MDPVGPWSAYASYNRLAGVQTGATSGDIHHLAPGAAVPPTTTAQLLPGGFLSPPPVGYETVFTPLFHHAANTKPPTHYVTQVTQQRAQVLAQAQAAASKQNENEYHHSQGFFEQGAWQQNSPFGILPHESVVATTTSKTVAYENFNPHFAAAQSLNHLASAKNTVTRAQSPQVTTATKTPASQANSTFFQVPTTFASTENTSTSKTFSSSSTNSNLQQSCIVSSPSNTPVTKEYRVPQAPARTAFISSPNTNRPPQTKQQTQTHIQTKAQTKIYPELSNQNDRQRNAEENQSQSSPISFSIMDVPGRLNYTGSNSSGKRTQFQHSNYRHYPQGNNPPEADFQRPKSGPDYNNSNGPDCNVVVPRRPSPLQAHSQASPLGHAQSPAYPMYNSPMNPISSPQHNTSNHVTPPSPLDVSVPRLNSQSGNVAYPSVITRALNTDKNFQERYDRNNQNQSNCWDDRQNRKFQQTNQSNNQPNSYSPGNNMEMPPRQIDLGNRTVESVQQRGASMGISERQQTYFESGHQVTLQDLSSCRGDPMSIVKNLQQQQSCQVQQPEIKQEVKVPVKRRKSNEKPSAPVSEPPGPPIEYFPGRIPPPAHSSASNQQQQNGSYFDFDRWNLPPPTAKMFGTQTVHQQHQGLMVPHPHTHHPPPPLPYFAPFHLPPPEFATTVELTPIPSYNEQSPQTSVQYPPPQEENQPKVVVPNIEEELNFLSEGGRPAGPQPTPIHSHRPVPLQPAVAAITKPQDKPSGPGAGFMNSYLKFLQGERDSSPPPSARGTRKQSWSRSTKPVIQTDVKPSESNGVPPVVPPPAPVTSRLSQGDPQDDPRYFPLPKERKRRSFDSSDDGLSSDEDLFKKKIPPPPVKTEPKPKNSRKGRPPKSGGSSERKKVKQVSREHKEKKREVKAEKIISEPLPRRESSKRAAKDKTNIKHLIEGDDAEEPPEFMDSDSDPAWTPAAKNEGEEEIVMDKKKRRGKQGGGPRKRASRNLISVAAHSAGLADSNTYSSDSLGAHTKKHKAAAGRPKPNVAPTLEDNIAAAVAMQGPAGGFNMNDDNPFKPGEFVVIRSELNQEWPAIWRVDGKTLLQKYEPFEQNGQTLYRNISTYTSWTPESKKQYVNVPVRYKAQSHLETIVEFLRSEMTVIDQEFFDKAINESEVYQDNFEVYIQTLISQALDSNFLTEIFQEKDDYFLSNVKTIDDITERKKHTLLLLLRWPMKVQVAVSTWPCFNVIRDLNVTDAQSRLCVTCAQPGVAVRVLLYGQPYNSTTLEGCPPDPQAVNEKDFLMCRICATKVELFNKVSHQKYLMYIECAKRVAEKRTAEAHKDTTCILNELLADESWLSHMFAEVRKSWAEVDCLEHSYRLKNAKVQ